MEKLKSLILEYRKLLIEGVLISLSLVIIAISAVLYFASSSAYAEVQQKPVEAEADLPVENSQGKIIVDISGAVMKPDSYKLESTARLKDALTLAGGLSEMADKEFFYRNYNLARGLADQEKIYIPSILEVSNGIFKESYRLVNFTETSLPTERANTSGKISINEASIEELDTLPGVGKTTAEKIIDNRPFASIDDLSNNSIVGKAVYEKIKDFIEL